MLHKISTMRLFLKVELILAFHAALSSCTVDGTSYMEALLSRNNMLQKTFRRGEDPCNPLYWYPKALPEHCGPNKTLPIEKGTPVPPLPVPIPVPMAPPPGLMPSPPAPMPYPMPIPLPVPMPLPPLPYGVPVEPSYPMIPTGAQFFPSYPPPYISQLYPPQPFSNPLVPVPPRGPMAGFVPGLPGMVSPDGGINVMPFSDVYSDMLEKHRNKMMRKEMEEIINKYSRNSWGGYRRHRSNGKRYIRPYAD